MSELSLDYSSGKEIRVSVLILNYNIAGNKYDLDAVVKCTLYCKMYNIVYPYKTKTSKWIYPLIS